MANAFASPRLVTSHTSASAPFQRARRSRLNVVSQCRSDAAAPDRRSVLLGLGSMLSAVQALPSFAAKETAQVGDYLPASSIDGFVEFVPDRKKVSQPTAQLRNMCNINPRGPLQHFEARALTFLWHVMQTPAIRAGTVSYGPLNHDALPFLSRTETALL